MRMKDWSIEELKTAAGLLMVDLRGNWAYDYIERLNELDSLLVTLLEREGLSENDQASAEEAMKVLEEEMESFDYDGRVFRDCEFYGKDSSGLTERVREWLMMVCTHPEYID